MCFRKIHLASWLTLLVLAVGLFSLCALTSKRFSLSLCREDTNESCGRVQRLVEEHMDISLLFLIMRVFFCRRRKLVFGEKGHFQQLLESFKK